MSFCDFDKARKLFACVFVIIFLSIALVLTIDKVFYGNAQSTVVASSNEITNVTVHQSWTLNPEIEVIEFDYKGVHYTCIWIHSKFRGGLSCFQNTTKR